MCMGNASSYANGPLLAIVSKGPQNLGANLLHLQVDMISYFIIFIFYFPIRADFLEVLCFFKVLLDLVNQMFHVH